MAHVIYGDETAVFNALAYSAPHPSTLQFIQNQASAFTENLTNAGRTFMDSVHQVYQWVDQSKAMELARQVHQQLSGIWQVDVIASYHSLEQFQSAGPQMQRWIMANPFIREQYHQQLCEGYAGSYVDLDPGLVGNAHYDYRRATDGLMIIEEDGNAHATTWFEELREGDRDLSLAEQADIRQGWTNITAFYKPGLADPTSKSGATL